MFITTKAFDTALQGKAVKLTGELIEGNYIISRVHSKTIEVVGSGKSSVAVIKGLQMADFEDGKIEMIILEPPKDNIIDVEAMETLPEIEFIKPEKKHKTGFKRNQGSRNIRSYLQIKVDNAHVEWILQQNIEPLKLEEILKRMQNDHGHWHWSNSNASGFVKRAIKDGKRIKQIGYGCYGYDWEAAK